MQLGLHQTPQRGRSCSNKCHKPTKCSKPEAGNPSVTHTWLCCSSHVPGRGLGPSFGLCLAKTQNEATFQDLPSASQETTRSSGSDSSVGRFPAPFPNPHNKPSEQSDAELGVEYSPSQQRGSSAGAARSPPEHSQHETPGIYPRAPAHPWDAEPRRCPSSAPGTQRNSSLWN